MTKTLKKNDLNFFHAQQQSQRPK